MKFCLTPQLVFTSLLLLTFTYELKAQDQFTRDNAGNPVLSEEYVEAVIVPMQFESIDNKVVTVADLKGKIVVIDFWQTWCKPCLIGFRGLQKAKTEWPDKIEILAASPDWSDNTRKIKKFSNDKGYDFSFVLAGELESMLKINSIPYKIILDPSGKLISTKSGARSADAEYREIKKLIKEYEL